MNQGIPAQDATLLHLARLIQDKCGLNYVENTQALSVKLQGRVQELGLSYWEYGELLRKDEVEWATLAELVTINETYFFREEQQLEELRANVVRARQASGQPIRIWSAACSSGEEPYSIAMTLWDAGAAAPGSAEVIGTDINRRVLSTARGGWYHRNSLCFRRTPPEAQARYFVPEGDGFRVRPEISRLTRFQEMNLMDQAAIRTIGAVDVIFCRNVLIYFDADTTDRLIRAFYEALKPGGYLFLGHAETLGPRNKELFETIHTPTTFYYRKGA